MFKALEKLGSATALFSMFHRMLALHELMAALNPSRLGRTQASWNVSVPARTKPFDISTVF